MAPVAATIDDTHPVELVFPEGCPSFAGRVIRNIDPTATSPLWMAEHLRRAGLRTIHPVVDVTNYVMLELGQPLHAYDLALVNGPIRPRLAKKGEKVTLLDEKEVELNEDTLVITDDSGPIGMAGIMGGLSTAVSDATADVFFEAAFWPQEFIAGRARSYGMHTDASLRFERGVDPSGQARAVERATELLLEISGGEPGPLVLDTVAEYLPQPKRFACGASASDCCWELRSMTMSSKTFCDDWASRSPQRMMAGRSRRRVIDSISISRLISSKRLPASSVMTRFPKRPQLPRRRSRRLPSQESTWTRWPRH